MDYPANDRAVIRVATRLSAAYIMRAALLAIATSDGDIMLALVLAAIKSANVDYLDHPPHNATHFHGLDLDVPDDLRRPVSVLALAGSLGIPYETARRHVNRLVKRGYCIKVRGGVIATSAAVNTPLEHDGMFQNLANLRRLFKDLKRFNVDLD
jgi:hypothetical protein